MSIKVQQTLFVLGVGLFDDGDETEVSKDPNLKLETISIGKPDETKERSAEEKARTTTKRGKFSPSIDTNLFISFR